MLIFVCRKPALVITLFGVVWALNFIALISANVAAGQDPISTFTLLSVKQSRIIEACEGGC